MDRASLDDLRVLMALCAHPHLTQDVSIDGWESQVASVAGCERDSVISALAFWRGAGVVSMGTASKKATATPKIEVTAPMEAPAPVVQPSAPVAQPTPVVNVPKPRMQRSAELPKYTTEELATLLESRAEVQALVNECQRVWGKMFNTSEVNIILGLVDYLELDPEYVLCLLAYYASDKQGEGLKPSLRNVERRALELFDKDIQTVEALHHEIRRMEQFKSAESQLRTLFGMGGRALTPTEKKFFSAWLYDFGYGMDVIRMAYDVTVDAKGAPNLKYMNSVLANWHKDNLRTPAEVEAAQIKFREANAPQKKANPEHPGSTFDTEDFFAAAVRRNFGDDFDEGQG